MTQPKRPTKNPKPIGRHPHAGQYAVVVSFRMPLPFLWDIDRVQGSLTNTLEVWAEDLGIDPPADLDVAVRVIGAAGEASEMEGTVGPLAVTIDVVDPLAPTEDDIQTVRTTRDQDNIETRGRT